MKKLIACLPILSILLVSCTTFSPVGRDRGFNFPKPEKGTDIDIWKTSGGQIDGEMISIDQDILLPPPPGIEPVVRINAGDPAKLWAFLMIYTVLRELIETGISIPSIPW